MDKDDYRLIDGFAKIIAEKTETKEENDSDYDSLEKLAGLFTVLIMVVIFLLIL